MSCGDVILRSQFRQKVFWDLIMSRTTFHGFIPGKDQDVIVANAFFQNAQYDSCSSRMQSTLKQNYIQLRPRYITCRRSVYDMNNMIVNRLICIDL